MWVPVQERRPVDDVAALVALRVVRSAARVEVGDGGLALYVSGIRKQIISGVGYLTSALVIASNASEQHFFFLLKI